MPELDPAPDADQDDAEYLTAANAALDEDQRRQPAQSDAAAFPDTLTAPTVSLYNRQSAS
jgi:hypothetical protein